MKKVTILGGGIIGLCTAYALVQAGISVQVIDQKSIGDSCAKGNAGYISPSHFIPLSAPGMIKKGLAWMLNPESPFYIRPRWDFEFFKWLWQFSRHCNSKHTRRVEKFLLEFNLESDQLHQQLWNALDQNFEFYPHGLYVVCDTQATLSQELEHARHAQTLGLHTLELTAADFKQREPNLNLNINGGVFYQQDSHVRPDQLLFSLHQYLLKQGVNFFENVTIDSIETQGNRITKLIAQQQEFEVDELILAAGVWSSLLAKLLKLNLPVQAGKGYSVTVDKPWQTETPMILSEARVAISPFANKMRFGGTMELAGIDTQISQSRIDGLLKSVARYLPDFKPEQVPNDIAWFGLRPCSPDGLPLIGRIRQWDNLIVATGHAMLGLSLAPVTGLRVKQLLCHEKFANAELINPHRFKL